MYIIINILIYSHNMYIYNYIHVNTEHSASFSSSIIFQWPKVMPSHGPRTAPISNPGPCAPKCRPCRIHRPPPGDEEVALKREGENSGVSIRAYSCSETRGYHILPSSTYNLYSLVYTLIEYTMIIHDHCHSSWSTIIINHHYHTVVIV